MQPMGNKTPMKDYGFQSDTKGHEPARSGQIKDSWVHLQVYGRAMEIGLESRGHQSLFGKSSCSFFPHKFHSWDMFRLPSSNEVNRCILFWMEKLLVYWGLPCVDVAKHMRAARLRALVTSPRPLKTSRNWRSSAIHDRDTAIQRYGKNHVQTQP